MNLVCFSSNISSSIEDSKILIQVMKVAIDAVRTGKQHHLQKTL